MQPGPVGEKAFLMHNLNVSYGSLSLLPIVLSQENCKKSLDLSSPAIQISKVSLSPHVFTVHQVLFCKAVFQPVIPYPALLYGVVGSHLCDSAFNTMSAHFSSLCRSFQRALFSTVSNHSLQSVIIQKVAERARRLIIQAVNQNTQQN